MLTHLENAAEFFIPSPMVERLHERVIQWTWCGYTGGVIAGSSRCGKSTALRALDHAITTRDGDSIPLFRVTYGERDATTIRSVFNKVARSLGFKVKTSHRSDDLVEMICLALADAAAINRTRQVILVVDEAQILTIQQLSGFAEIFNVLFELHTNIVIIFAVNSDQFQPLAEQLLQKKNTYLRERFFSQVYEFYGIQTESELASCLRAYANHVMDNDRRISAWQWYCPALDKLGWTLDQIAEPYWRLYDEHYREPLGQTSWPMAQFVRATNILLMDYLSNVTDMEDSDYVEGCIIHSLEAAGIRPSLANITAMK